MNKHCRTFAGFILSACIVPLAFMLGVATANAAESTTCDFQCTLKKHLGAIQARDFPTFASTITSGPVIDFILPRGQSFTSREEYMDLLKGWFAQNGWHFNYEIVRTIEGKNLAVALLKVSYDEDERDGKPYHIDHFLNLTFQNQHGEWRLVLDQNTLIQP